MYAVSAYIYSVSFVGSRKIKHVLHERVRRMLPPCVAFSIPNYLAASAFPANKNWSSSTAARVLSVQVLYVLKVAIRVNCAFNVAHTSRVTKKTSEYGRQRSFIHERKNPEMVDFDRKEKEQDG